MKRFFALLACSLAAMSANAAFISLPDGVTPSAPQVELEGSRLGNSFGTPIYNVNNPIRVLTQFQLSALDEATDDLNGDGLLTIFFEFYAFDGSSDPVFLDFGATTQNSVTWASINTAKASADNNDELTFDVFFQESVEDVTSLVTDGSIMYLALARGEYDSTNTALLNIGADFVPFFVANPPPPTPPPSVSAPATVGIFGVAMLAFAARRRISVK